VEGKDPLSDLADIHLPPPVSPWPPAPLWWMLAALVLGLIAYACLVWFRRWQLLQRQQHALDEIRQARALWQQTADKETIATPALLHTCNSVLKRVALVHYPETTVASLNGSRWLAFLDQSGGTDKFSQGPASLLADGGYRRTIAADADAVTALTTVTEQWIERQYRQKRRSAASKPEAA
jgi:hypothetical protein